VVGGAVVGGAVVGGGAVEAVVVVSGVVVVVDVDVVVVGVAVVEVVEAGTGAVVGAARCPPLLQLVSVRSTVTAAAVICVFIALPPARSACLVHGTCHRWGRAGASVDDPD
jgi:hypothetical protein